jgi:hypothetical protein
MHVARVLSLGALNAEFANGDSSLQEVSAGAHPLQRQTPPGRWTPAPTFSSMFRIQKTRIDAQFILPLHPCSLDRRRPSRSRKNGRRRPFYPPPSLFPRPAPDFAFSTKGAPAPLFSTWVSLNHSQQLYLWLRVLGQLDPKPFLLFRLRPVQKVFSLEHPLALDAAIPRGAGRPKGDRRRSPLAETGSS